MSLCTERTIVNEGASEGTYSTLKCKRWSCDECRPMLKQRVARKARDGNPNIFLTLTWNANRSETPDQAARVMKHAWVLLRRRIAKKFDIKNVPFIVVFERTKKGWPHMHLLLRSRYIKQAWLSEQMNEIMEAPIVDIRKIPNRNAVMFYITKYIGKDLAAFEGCKRWWRSHNYEEQTEDPFVRFMFGEKFEIVDISYNIMRQRIAAGSYNIIDEHRGFVHFTRRISGGYRPREVSSAFRRTSA